MNRYVLPNRKEFADSIARIFKRTTGTATKDVEDEGVDLCSKGFSSTRELYPYQKLIVEYLKADTPYRGLLVYHGLGSGKTCSAIAVAESLLTTRKIYVMAPRSLITNFRGEIRKCGDSIYQTDQNWEMRTIRSDQDREEAKGMGISDGFLDKNNGKFFITVPERPSNFREQPMDAQKLISAQIDDVIDQRFKFIAYNGISKTNIDTIFPPDTPNMLDDSVIIIDEAHNFISAVVGESILKTRIYDMIYNAKNTKVVCLSGTPILNRPQEISYLMNLIHGPIERVTIPTTQAISWDEGLMTAYFRKLPDVDTVEYNSVKKSIMLTRNPPNFETVMDEKNQRIAVKFNKDLPYEPDIIKWVDTWRGKFAREFGGIELAEQDKLVKEQLESLPTKFEEFATLFLDGLKIKNVMLFQRRIQGLVSYYKGADERLLPRRIDDDKMLIKIPMSDEQFGRYLDRRFEEIQQDSKRGRMKNDVSEDMGSYRVKSRLTCNFALPEEFTPQEGADVDETTVTDKSEILDKLRAKSEQYFTPEALLKYSPKMAEMLKRVKESVGEGPEFKSQLIYSFYKSLEGLGVFSAVLDTNGFQRYRILKDATGIWKEDPDMRPGVPSYAMFTGGEDEVEREFYRQIFNNHYESSFPQSLRDTITERRLCVLMISKAGAEGINLENVRDVHVMEGHWNPALISQVVGRAIRICSHAKLPIPDRTVRIHMYLTVFSKEQSVTSEGNNIVSIRRNDTELKRYDGGDPVDAFMTTDEFVYNVSYKKNRITQNITHILKQAAIDCEIHRVLHSREQPVIQCMRFDTTVTGEDLAYSPSIKSDERDELYMRNIVRRKRRLQRVRVKGIVLLIDPDSNEVFDEPAFADNQRLLRIGKRVENEIRFFV
jgi:hypothetical protein